MIVKIGCIVEGESEVATVPLLIRRIAAAAKSLRGQRGLKNDLNSPANPEAIRDAKRWLSGRMENNKTYRETQDQPALAVLFDIEQARQADSFDKCYRDIVRLLGELRDSPKV